MGDRQVSFRYPQRGHPTDNTGGGDILDGVCWRFTCVHWAVTSRRWWSIQVYIHLLAPSLCQRQPARDSSSSSSSVVTRHMVPVTRDIVQLLSSLSLFNHDFKTYEQSRQLNRRFSWYTGWVLGRQTRCCWQSRSSLNESSRGHRLLAAVSLQNDQRQAYSDGKTW